MNGKGVVPVYPPTAYEHFVTEYCDDFGFVVHGKRLKEGFVPPPVPEPCDPAVHAGAKLALEAASGGRNTLLCDDLGLPSVMVRVPCFLWSDVMDGAPEVPCSAFVVGGKVLDCIYIGKYLNVVEHGRAYSLPARNPAGMYTLDEARAACAAKGKGWHLLTNAEWMALAFWAKKNGTLPRGNNAWGSDFLQKHERGVTVDIGSFSGTMGEMPMRPVLTGTGPASWSHDGTPFGVYDMNGNLWDMVAGLRLNEGEIQIIPDNDSALNVDEGPKSDAWRAIRTDGTLVLPGSPGTYKYDGAEPGHADDAFVNLPAGVRLSTEVRQPQYFGIDSDRTHKAYSMFFFSDLTHEASAAPNLLIKQLGLYPPTEEKSKTMFFVRNYAERTPCRGGSWFDRETAGLWELYLRDTRAWVAQDIGFRCAYVDV
ncbi:MAG: formylglycine-generating enzyme family protein [Clostridiales Family XIII bacterium]|jgi:hypothetical protein|nr:formylglycine-generating enzyme family protein [Clostridiales Family XIII bacterium]